MHFCAFIINAEMTVSSFGCVHTIGELYTTGNRAKIVQTAVSMIQTHNSPLPPPKQWSFQLSARMVETALPLLAPTRRQRVFRIAQQTSTTRQTKGQCCQCRRQSEPSVADCATMV